MLWAYKIIAGQFSEEELNEFGDEGWELLAITGAQGDRAYNYVFKQPYPEQTEYKVVYGKTLSQLTTKVLEHIADGWQPQGGIAVDAWFEDGPFMQPLIRD